jgi:hypothetical protein
MTEERKGHSRAAADAPAQEKESYLVLSGIRLFRAFIGQKDDFYYRHIIKAAPSPYTFLPTCLASYIAIPCCGRL